VCIVRVRVEKVANMGGEPLAFGAVSLLLSVSIEFLTAQRAGPSNGPRCRDSPVSLSKTIVMCSRPNNDRHR